MGAIINDRETNISMAFRKHSKYDKQEETMDKNTQGERNNTKKKERNLNIKQHRR